MSTQEQEKLVAQAGANQPAADTAMPGADDAAGETDTVARPRTASSSPEQTAEQTGTQAAEQAADHDAEQAADLTRTAEPANPWQEIAQAAQASQTNEPAVQPAAAPATAADGNGGSLPPDTVPGRDDDVPALPEDNASEEEEEGQGGRMSLMDHLRELRQRICYSLAAAFVGFLICWYFVEPVFDILTRPLLDVLPEGSSAMYTTLPEAFFTRMYIAFILGLFVASPFIFYQIWAFISPGLYDEEKHFIMPVAVVSAVFFVLGGIFCYFIVFKYAFSFFMTFVTAEIQAMPKISDYLDFVLKLLLAFGFIFEMPIFAFFLSRMGIVTAARMRRGRRYAILIIFIVAAILTPPDVVSQILMAVPMLILYEVSIFVAAIFGRKEEPKPAGDDDDEDDDYADEDADDYAEEHYTDEPEWQSPAPATAAAGTASGTTAQSVTRPAAQADTQTSAHPAAQTQSVPDTAAEGQAAATQQPDVQSSAQPLVQSDGKARGDA